MYGSVTHCIYRKVKLLIADLPGESPDTQSFQQAMKLPNNVDSYRLGIISIMIFLHGIYFMVINVMVYAKCVI